MNASNLRKLPDFTQLDLFSAEYTDIATRMLQDVMWRPFFALGKRPRFEPIVYQAKDVEIMITGAKPDGIATIWDADILMWVISQVIEARDRGEETSQQIYFTPYDCLRGIYRRTSGYEYQQVMKAIRRLHGTTVRTNIRKSDDMPLSPSDRNRLEVGFHWLESYGIQYVERNGKKIPQGVTAILPNWLYRAVIRQRNVLTIDDRYFSIKGGIERVLYLIARKHVGMQQAWGATMKELYRKTGSDAPFKNFAITVRKLVERDSLPEYALTLHRNEQGEEVVTFWKRSYLDYKDSRYEPPRESKKIQRLRPATNG